LFIFWFQFLIGTLRTLTRPPTFSSETGVSIPHRYAENEIDITAFPLPEVEVSIPHRYTENAFAVPFGHFSKGAFQFLIGTLRTITGKRMNNSLPVFQFLIGTLRTRKSELFYFNSLRVSIPHRYAENACLVLYPL